jgi:Carboxypeptidase regulatory-like domain
VLPMPAAGTTVATIDLPGDPAAVRVEPGIVTRRQSAAGRTVIEATLEPGKRARVSWSVREAAVQAPPLATRTLADVKSLVTIGDADLRLVSLVEITVVRGEPRTFDIRLPDGFDVASVSGTSVETSRVDSGTVTLTVVDGTPRRHQFLLALERSRADSSFAVDTSFPTVSGAQREVGEVAIEATGAVEVTASGDTGLRRMDVREMHPSLRALAGRSLLAAFRYQRRPDETRTLSLDVTRFADAPVVAAVAERAVATTLVTSEGRMLTEVQLTLRNRAQPFMKVVLPEGADILSVEVAGETAQPVTGIDGIRVPLLRVGFKPHGPYVVSFVYRHGGEALGKRGEARMALPPLDVPVSVLEWELFFPDRFSAKPSAGNVMPARLLGLGSTPAIAADSPTVFAPAAQVGGRSGGSYQMRVIGPGQIVGRVTDHAGGVIPGARVTVREPAGAAQAAVTDANGFYSLIGIVSGRIRVRAELEGFRSVEQAFEFDQRPRQLDFQLAPGAISETVTVRAEAPLLDAVSRAARDEAQVQQAPSPNVLNLQRRVAGVLPVRIDVPRTGALFAFARPLVLQEETLVVFKYKRR